MRRRHRDQGWNFQPVRPGAGDNHAPVTVTPAFGGHVITVGEDGNQVSMFRPAPPPQATIRKAAWKAGHRHRRQLVPWLLLPLLPLAVLAGRAGHAQIALTIAAVLAGGFLARQAWPKVRKARWPAAAYRLGVPVAAAGWVTWASWAGLRHGALPVYIAGWAVPSLAWWNRHRIRHYHGRTALQQTELTPDELLLRLRTRICGSGQRLAGATVTEAGPMKGGRAFILSGVPGKQTFEQFRAASGEIASAAETARSRVVVEPAPGELPGEEGPANQARIIILDAKNTHREIQEFTGMTLARETGLFSVGFYPDGDIAPARLYKVDEHGRPMRAASGLTCGAQGSGKSRYIEHKMTEHLMSGLFKVFLIDGQGGASVPALLDHVDWPATRPDEWTVLLRALVRLMIARTRLISSRRIPCWYATPEEPFVQLFVEEAHKPLRDPLNLRMIKALLQEGEKAGIGVDPVTQFPSQVELGGASGTTGANVLRSLASAGNVVLFRTGDESSKAMAVGQVEVNPRLLPQVPGMCHPLGASMRLAPARAIRVAEPAGWASQAPETTFSDLDLAALGGDYATRWDRFAEADAEQGADSLDMDSLAAELALITGEEAPARSGTARAEAAPGPTVPSRIMAIIRKDGSAKRANLIKELGCSESAVDQALKALANNGGVTKGKGGIWELASTTIHAVPQTASTGTKGS